MDQQPPSVFLDEAEEKPVHASFYRREWWEDTKFDPKKNYPRGDLGETCGMMNSSS